MTEVTEVTEVDSSTPDPIFAAFLRDARDRADRIFANSDLVEGEWQTPQHLLLHFRCHGLVKTPDGRIEERDDFAVGIVLASHYLTWVDPVSIVTVLSPSSLFHPNTRGPLACLGPIEPGTLIDDLIFRVYDLICFNNFTKLMGRRGEIIPIGTNILIVSR